MGDLDLDQALSNLRRIQNEPERALGCRETLLSFVWIDTVAHHWPSKVSAEIESLRATFSFLKIEERSRFLKQRRLVLNRLVRTFT